MRRRTAPHGSGTTATLPAGVEWIDTLPHLERFVEAARRAPRYAIDTEFHRERTYYPHLALVQIAFVENDKLRIGLIDPLAVERTPLAELCTTGPPAIFHAARQDLEVLAHAVGAIPTTIFDTQLAAGFLGHSTPSLASLVAQYCDTTLEKGDRLTDWMQRPLTESQLRYAANDVRYLLDLAETVEAALTDAGRLSWATAACEELRTKPVSYTVPGDAWHGVSGVRALPGPALAVAVELARWREERAQRVDVLPRRVLPDTALLAIAQRAPLTDAELRAVRGCTLHRPAEISGVLAAVAKGIHTEPPRPAPRRPAPDHDAVTLVLTWVGEVARRVGVERTLLAAREDVERFVAGEPSAIQTGWRAALLGEAPARLVAGTLALARNGRSGVRCVEC